MKNQMIDDRRQAHVCRKAERYRGLRHGRNNKVAE